MAPRVAAALLVALLAGGTGRASTWMRVEEEMFGGDHAIVATTGGGVLVLADPGVGSDTFWRLDDTGGTSAFGSFFYSGSSTTCRAICPDEGYVTSGWLIADPSRPGAPASTWVARADASGLVQWAVVLDPSDVGADVQPRAIAGLADGTVLVTGHTSSGPDTFVAKLSAAGDVRASRSFPGALFALCQRPDGAYILAGLVTDGAGRPRPLVIETTSALSTAWQRTYDLPAWNAGDVHYVKRVEPTASGVLAVLDDGSLLDLDLDGGVRAAWSSPDLAVSHAMPLPDGFAMVATERAGAIAGDVVVASVSSSGVPRWSRRFGGPLVDWAGRVAPAPDGGTYFTATIAAGASSGLAMVKLDENGDAVLPCGPLSDAGVTLQPVTMTSAPITFTARLVGLSAATSGSARVVPRVPEVTEPCLACLPDPYEHDGCPGRGTPLDPGGRHVRNFCDDDEDWASLALAAGDEVTIETAELGPFADTIVAILSPGCGLVLAEDDDTAGGRASRLSFTAPSAGSYRVRVRQSDGSSGPDRGYVLVRSRLIPRECGAFAQGVGEPSESPALLDLEVLDDGAIVMAGSVVDPVSGVLGWLVRGAAEGGFVPVTRFWQRELVAVANVGSGRTVVASWTDGDVPGAEDALALGLDDGGDVTWTKAWRLDDSGAARAFGVAAAGAEAIVGANVELASGDYAQLVHLARFGADGSMTWSRELRLGRALAGTSMASSPSGGVIVSARSAAGVAGAPVVMKVEADGALAWGVALDVDLVPGSASAAATSDGGAALAGVTAGGRLVVARLDASGSVTWSSAWDANGGFGTRMTKLSARGEFLVVLAEDVSTGSTWLARVDATGATVSQSLAWEGGARIDGLAIDRAGSVLLCGATTTGDGALLARLDAADRPPSGCAAAPTPLAIESPLAVASSALTIATRDVAPLMVARTPSAGPDWGLSADLCPCERLPPPLPTEVSPPGSPVPLRVTRRGLSWENAAANGSESFLVYRGELAELRVGTAGSCHASGAIAPSLMDDEDPPSGTGWFYLVAGRNAGGDGPLGDGGLGPRVPASACP